ncbi:MAG TPA: HD domain-containing phosphohydrolase [Anaerolineales bacterium]|nr:HD domain-containing phosphohydrolase [Anaerolineales bacterium]
MMNHTDNNDIILIVEDNDVLRQGLIDMLAFEGFKVFGARNGLEALDQMNVVNPELIISDVSMPLMDGFSFFQALRNRQEWVTVPFIFLTARVDPVDVLHGKNLGADDYLTKPITRDELVTAIQSRLTRMRQVQSAQMQQAYQESLKVMANAIDQRDPLVQGHVDRVVDYALVLAHHLGWNEQELEELRFGAILHDIGKIHISEHILLKTDPLDEKEWQEIRMHSTNGSEMLKDIPQLAEVVPYVRHHHENWDGSGYPDGLRGEQIPLGARILAIADAFDAMTSPHRYSEVRSLEEAMDELQEGAGTRYDPKLIRIFTIAWHNGEIFKIAASLRQMA